MKMLIAVDSTFGQGIVLAIRSTIMGIFLKSETVIGRTRGLTVSMSTLFGLLVAAYLTSERQGTSQMTMLEFAYIKRPSVYF